MALLEQDRQERRVAPHDGQQVGADDPLPLLHRDLLGQPDGEDADVVHHDVHPPELLEHDVASRVEVRLLIHVELHPDARRTLRRRFLGDRVRGITVEVGDEHVGSGFREREHGGPSHAARATGDQRGSSVECVHQRFGSSSWDGRALGAARRAREHHRGDGRSRKASGQVNG